MIINQVGGGAPPDGKLWTRSTNTPSNNNYVCAAYGKRQFVALSRNDSIHVSDGTGGWVVGSGHGDTVAYGNGVFVAVDTRTCEVLVSSDGVNWTSFTPLTMQYPTAIAYGGGYFVVVGMEEYPAGLSDYYSYFEYSRDGVTWTLGEISHGSVSQYNFNDIAYGDGYFVACGSNANSSSPAIARWAPGDLSWTFPQLPENTDDLTSIAFGDGYFWAVGTMTTIQGQNAGGTWSSIGGQVYVAGSSTDMNATFYVIRYGNGKFVASGRSSGTGTDFVAYREDYHYDWIIPRDSLTLRLYDAVFARGRFVGSGPSGKLYYSRTTNDYYR